MSEQESSEIERTQSIRWQTVLDAWQAGEEAQWEPVFRERGFTSWWEWRKTYVAELEMDQREWKERVVVRPHEVIPAMAIGGFQGWKQYRPAGKDVALYADIVRPPAPGELAYNGQPRVDIRTNQKVMSLVGNLHDTTILVLRCPSLSVALDGTHRCSATALEAHAEGPRSSFVARLQICEFSETERPLLEAFARDRESMRR